MVESKPTVVITGISGYIGLHILKVFLEDGSFRVRGTVRSKTEQKLMPIKLALGDALFSQLEIVEADLLKADSLTKAIEGCTYVVHSASPCVIKNPENADVLVKPAVEGTLAVVRACHANKVKRLVVTSSTSAVRNVRPENKPHVLTEEVWSDIEYMQNNYYFLSKTLAEKAAWNFLNELPEGERFELVTLLPSMVVGKPLDNHQFTSGEVIHKFFTGEYPNLNI